MMGCVQNYIELKTWEVTLRDAAVLVLILAGWILAGSWYRRNEIQLGIDWIKINDEDARIVSATTTIRNHGKRALGETEVTVTLSGIRRLAILTVGGHPESIGSFDANPDAPLPQIERQAEVAHKFEKIPAGHMKAWTTHFVVPSAYAAVHVTAVAHGVGTESKVSQCP